MFMRLAPDHLDLCARAVARMGSDQPEEIRASLAWVIKNRLHLAADAAAPPDLAQTCREVLLEAVGPQDPDLPHAALPDTEWCRLYAVNCLVWSGDLADPTGGAISCHRHDTTKKWARSRTPTALLGPYIFYR